MKRIVNVILLLILSVNISYANNDSFGKEIVKCFHPTAEYISINIDPISTEQLLDNKLLKINGKVNYKGGFLGKAYYMEFLLSMQYDNNKLKYIINPTKDTASFAPNKKCKFLNINHNTMSKKQQAIVECGESMRTLIKNNKRVATVLQKSNNKEVIKRICDAKSNLYLKGFEISNKFYEIDLYIDKLSQIKKIPLESMYKKLQKGLHGIIDNEIKKNSK
jgi:hypothetical protein